MLKAIFSAFNTKSIPIYFTIQFPRVLNYKFMVAISYPGNNFYKASIYVLTYAMFNSILNKSLEHHWWNRKVESVIINVHFYPQSFFKPHLLQRKIILY